MKLEFRKLEKRDEKKAIQFAVEGMHFNWYTRSRLLQNLYGRYFWYLAMTRATQVIAVYQGESFAGVLLAEMKEEKKQYDSCWKMLYIKVFNMLQNIVAKDGTRVYQRANKEMFLEYCQSNIPDGEIIFLAANPAIKARGIGSALLTEFEQKERGKKIYLYTDNACTYQFYEHRGFERSCEKDIVLNLGNKSVPLKCLLYSRELL